jgi:hypothetical protein
MRSLTVIVVTGGVVIALALTWAWAPDRDTGELRKRWAPAPSQFIDIAGQMTHLRDEGPPGHDGAAGRPSPIILIHGTSSSLHT